jgi:hypothetical protein
MQPLDLPELQELQPLLNCLPGSSSSTGGWGEGDEDDIGGYEYQDQQQQQQVPRLYPELQFLRSFLQLQQAAAALAELQQKQQQAQAQGPEQVRACILKFRTGRLHECRIFMQIAVRLCTPHIGTPSQALEQAQE